jgi:hypothetical protein
MAQQNNQPYQDNQYQINVPIDKIFALMLDNIQYTIVK